MIVCENICTTGIALLMWISPAVRSTIETTGDTHLSMKRYMSVTYEITIILSSTPIQTCPAL